MRSTWRVLSGLLALMLVGLGLVWTVPQGPVPMGRLSRSQGGLLAGAAVSQADPPLVLGPVEVGDPVTPTLTVAARDLPPVRPEDGLPLLNREMAPREVWGFTGPDVDLPPHGNLLVERQRSIALAPDAAAVVTNFAGAVGYNHPPDDTGDVGPNHYVQGVNTSATSRVYVFNKSGTQLGSFYMDDLAPSSPCNSGYCDPIIQYDRLADRWMISEFDTSIDNLCVYVSRTSDPLGQYWAYAFNPAGTNQDYPHYGVWPDGYYVSANNGGYVHALDRQKMLNGQAATYQSFSLATLPGFGFQLTMPGTLDGASPAPPANAPAIFIRPRDTEIHGGTCSGCDLMEMWQLHVDWTTPGNSALTQLTSIQMSDWDQTVCGTVQFGCMPQPDTTQLIDPIREPIHYPLQYRNFTTHETLVGCFVEDEDGTDHVGVHWFEIRRTPPGSGSWVLQQEGVLGGDAQHRGVCSAAMDGGGNMIVGYTRTGASAPYYPSIYYSGRLSTDPLGAMTVFDQVIWDATTSHTGSDRWGDYAGVGVDPVDDCTVWFTTEYGGSGNTRIAGIRFEPLEATPATVEVCQGSNALYNVNVVKGCFKTAVTMSTSGRPAGTTESWSVNPVTPSGTTVLTIGNTGALAAGTYNFDVVGTAAGPVVYQDTVALKVVAGVPGTATLTAPANGSVGQGASPTFTWNAVTGAASYELQVATDPAFTALVINVTSLTGTSYKPGTPLAADTVYYWRVRAVNACGNGVYSAPWAFRTGAVACSTYNSTGGPWPIPDEGCVNSTINVGVVNTIQDVNVTIGNITHPRDSHVAIYAWHPDATQVALSLNNGGNGANYVNTVFDDEAATPITSGTPPFTGQFRPQASLTAFDNKGENGTWTLHVCDTVANRTGTLNSWSLTLCDYSGVVGADYSDLAVTYGVAWHTGSGALKLGATWTADTAFLPAGRDDTSDDGVSFPNGWVAGQANIVRVNVQGTATNGRWARIWFDWNGDGVFGDEADGERVRNVAVNDGNNDLSVNVPAGLTQPVYYRVRLYDSSGMPLAQDAGSYGGATSGEVEDGMSPAPTAVRLTSFTARSVAQGIVVTWETASEDNNAGFNLYRSDAPGVLGAALNENLIPSQAPGSGQGAAYEWLDGTAAPGVTYYYTLEAVDVYGNRAPYGPVVAGLWRMYLPVVGR